MKDRHETPASVGRSTRTGWRERERRPRTAPYLVAAEPGEG